MYYSLVKNPKNLMKSPGLFWDFYIVQLTRMVLGKLGRKRRQKGSVGQRKIHSPQQANQLIYEGLMSDKPFAVMRNGANELDIVLIKEFLGLGAIDRYPDRILKKGENNAGIFPASDSTAEVFAEYYSKANAFADVNVFWGHILCEKYLLDKYSPAAKIIPSRPLEPFGFEKPWTRALKGKKVLIIHPFAETIEKQYENRDKIFENQDYLPEFELKTIKAVQSSAGAECEFKDWEEALNHMKSEIDKTDFDIALLGCGGYAVPLAAYIKKIGKKAVVTGGFTQIMFGIKGGRWEKTRPDIVAMYNDYWVRPAASDKPKNSKSVEENAYW